MPLPAPGPVVFRVGCVSLCGVVLCCGLGGVLLGAIWFGGGVGGKLLTAKDEDYCRIVDRHVERVAGLIRVGYGFEYIRFD